MDLRLQTGEQDTKTWDDFSKYPLEIFNTSQQTTVLSQVEWECFKIKPVSYLSIKTLALSPNILGLLCLEERCDIGIPLSSPRGDSWHREVTLGLVLKEVCEPIQGFSRTRVHCCIQWASCENPRGNGRRQTVGPSTLSPLFIEKPMVIWMEI